MDATILGHIKAVYYPILAVFGIPANLLTIVTLTRGKRGLSKCISRYLLAMAVADLMVLIVNIIFTQIKDIHFPASFLDYTPICSFIFVLSVDANDCSVWLTVVFTIDRFIAICWQKVGAKYCTKKTAAMVIMLVYMFSFSLNSGFYFIFEAAETIDNIQLFCIIKSAFYTSPVWMTYYWLRTILTPFIPFVLISLLNTLTIRHITRATRVRRELLGSGKGTCQSDPETENRRKSIVLLLTISGSFIILWAVNLLYKISVILTDATLIHGDDTDPLTILGETGFKLQSLSSCTNTVIYAVAQNKFRAEMTILIKSPFIRTKTLINVCLKNT
ncbi:probable G-protein coupled receptor 139 [Hypanus sabinus]|uniref:probable G-protein coupled receptor 139 n=1 Tax=Hypanus sabinus TaxID=79690 RepID=UPI0028C42AF2|nr:probable G-protein coupled receptor 139 [Hypanus sabinus]